MHACFTSTTCCCLPNAVHALTLSSTQEFGFSEEFDFFTPDAVGADSTIHFLAIADLGQVTLDGSDEYDYDWSGDPLNEDATGTLMRVRPDTMHKA